MATVILWSGGLALFVASSLTIRADPAGATDAIVVLTGGKQRLETGVGLLAAGKAKELFISGVNPQVDRAILLHVLGPMAAQKACCIVLGHRADNTFENAHETASWAHGQGYGSLRLVTSWYHMQRSLLEFHRAMPQMTIIPQPVFATHVDPEGWWGTHGAGALIVVEYSKYLWALVRPAVDGLLPSPPGPPIRTTASPEDDARAAR